MTATVRPRPQSARPARARNALTLKDMAERLGVSTATMSNAFNRPDQLSRELREHILTECRDAGYSGPNAAARSLRTGRTGIIGVMLSNYLSYSFSDPVAHQFLQGLAEVFERHEYSLLVMPSREHLSQPHGYESFVDGFIVYGPPQREKLELLEQQRKSVITVDFILEGCASVNVDNQVGAKNCATHALRGNVAADKLAILGLRLIESDRVCRIQEGELFDEGRTITVHRLRGFLEAAEAVGAAIPAERIWQIPDNTHELGAQAAREALTCTPRPEVLLCMSDRTALAAIAVARSLGLRVPDDVRITGFDDIPEASTQNPALTTVRQPSLEKGRLAAEMFLGNRAEQSLVLPTQLMVRESCP